MRTNKALSFVAKYGKRLSKIVFEMLDRNTLEEFLQDCRDINLAFDPSRPYCFIVKDYVSAFRLITNPSYYADSTILVTRGLVSEVENKKFEDLYHEPLRNYNGKCIFIFDASPEAEVTKEMLKNEYKHLTFYDLPFGVSVRDPFLDEQSLFHFLLNIIYNDQLKKQKEL